MSSRWMTTSTRTAPTTPVTVGLRLEKKLREDSARPELALIWTTTPWTLPSNSAVAVGPEIEYSLVEVDAAHNSKLAGERVIIASDLIGAYAKELGEEPSVVATYKGSELVRHALPPHLRLL